MKHFTKNIVCQMSMVQKFLEQTIKQLLPKIHFGHKFYLGSEMFTSAGKSIELD